MSGNHYDDLLAEIERLEQELDMVRERLADRTAAWNTALTERDDLAARVRVLAEAAEEAYLKLTDIEGYGEHADNPLPTKLRSALMPAVYPRPIQGGKKSC